MKSRYIG